LVEQVCKRCLGVWYGLPLSPCVIKALAIEAIWLDGGSDHDVLPQPQLSHEGCFVPADAVAIGSKVNPWLRMDPQRVAPCCRSDASGFQFGQNVRGTHQ
jgi:hypothetical protein